MQSNWMVDGDQKHPTLLLQRHVTRLSYNDFRYHVESKLPVVFEWPLCVGMYPSAHVNIFLVRRELVPGTCSSAIEKSSDSSSAFGMALRMQSLKS